VVPAPPIDELSDANRHFLRFCHTALPAGSRFKHSKPEKQSPPALRDRQNLSRSWDFCALLKLFARLSRDFRHGPPMKQDNIHPGIHHNASSPREHPPPHPHDPRRIQYAASRKPRRLHSSLISPGFSLRIAAPGCGSCRYADTAPRFWVCASSECIPRGWRSALGDALARGAFATGHDKRCRAVLSAVWVVRH